METSFTKRVGCRVPIQQAPMGSVSTPALAVAVANAGAVGSITALGLPPARLDRMLAEIAAQTRGAVAVNFLTEDVDPEAVAVAARRARIVDFFWLEPRASLAEIAHAGGALVCWQVGSLDEALAAVDAGADIVVVQGTQAGGHVRGHSELLPLLASVVGKVQVPVLAAGGIADVHSFRRVLDAGAAGARIGTRFLATDESGAHPDYKAAVVAAAAGGTEITDAFAVCPLCATVPRARVLRSCIHALASLEGDVVGSTVWGRDTIAVPRGFGLPSGTSTTGHIEAMAMYCGEGALLIRDVVPAATVIGRLLG